MSLSLDAVRGERGSTSLEALLIFPVMMLLILGGAQAALYVHASNVALASAEEGVRVASARGSATAAGVSAATGFADSAGTLESVQVMGERGPLRTSFTVNGAVVTVVPGVHLSVSRSASLPTERLT